MKINSLRIAKFLSFGPQQELIDFKDFNLFIGKNGSGKTNTFKVLKGLEIDYEIVGNNYIDTSFKIQINTFTGVYSENRDINVYAPTMIMQQHINRDCYSSNIVGNLEIDYEVEFEGQNHSKKIKFYDDPDGTIRFSEGDVSILNKRVKLINIPGNESEFYKDLVLFFGSIAKSRLPFLNFALYYIFGLNYRFFEDGTFIQAKRSNSGSVENNSTSLPSGVLNCAKIITRYLMALDSDVILMDEPELHLEPRVIRKLIQFLIWINIKGKTNKTHQEIILFNQVDSIIKANWDSANNISIWATIQSSVDSVTIYDDISFNLPQKQLFIASHSSVLINEFINLGDTASIYNFDFINMEFLKDDNSKFPYKNFTIQQKGLFSQITRVDTSAIDILDNLGCKGSDLLQTNGVIWVEGPSDVIYLKKWLEIYCLENNFPFLQQGKNYDFQMFGGTLLDSLCLIKNDNSEEREKIEYKKLISMFSFSRNAFIVIDSDSVLNIDGEIIDKSKFSNAKKYIKKQVDLLKSQNQNLGLWFKEGDTVIRTIESYLDDISLKLKSENNWTKKICAQKITESWGTTKKLSVFKQNLDLEIKELFDIITEWNK